jgi:hypothetical protein
MTTAMNGKIDATLAVSKTAVSKLIITTKGKRLWLFFGSIA